MKRCLLAWASVLLSISACSGGGGSTDVCANSCTPPATIADFLTASDVQQIIAQAANEAAAQHAPATIAVTDRVGNVLGVFRMAGAYTTFRITSNRNVTRSVFGVEQNEYLNLFQVGPKKHFRGLLAVITTESLESKAPTLSHMVTASP